MRSIMSTRLVLALIQAWSVLVVGVPVGGNKRQVAYSYTPPTTGTTAYTSPVAQYDYQPQPTEPQSPALSDVSDAVDPGYMSFDIHPAPKLENPLAPNSKYAKVKDLGKTEFTGVFAEFDSSDMEKQLKEAWGADGPAAGPVNVHDSPDPLEAIHPALLQASNMDFVSVDSDGRVQLTSYDTAAAAPALSEYLRSLMETTPVSQVQASPTLGSNMHPGTSFYDCYDDPAGLRHCKRTENTAMVGSGAQQYDYQAADETVVKKDGRRYVFYGDDRRRVGNANSFPFRVSGIVGDHCTVCV